MTDNPGLRRWRRSKAYESRERPALNDTEQAVFNELRQDGWIVYRNGWPDFLAVRGDSVRLIEVKSLNDRVKLPQRRIHKALRQLGITVEVIRR